MRTRKNIDLQMNDLQITNKNVIDEIDVIITTASKKGEITSNYMNKPWLTTKEASLYLGTSVGAIRNQVWRSQLAAYKRLGRLYIKREELDRQIESCRQGAFK